MTVINRSETAGDGAIRRALIELVVPSQSAAALSFGCKLYKHRSVQRSGQQMKFPQIYCKRISCRSGFIEVLPNIHPGHIKLEVRNIGPDFNHSEADVSVPDEAVTGNPIQLDIGEARRLTELLAVVIEVADNHRRKVRAKELT